MTETLDFIIGGMPRGGTTAVGNLFNVPEDAYCYASETHWLPLLMEFAGRGPVPSQSMGLVERILTEQNRHVLFEMARFSVSRGAHPRALIFDENDVITLSRMLIGLLWRGYWGEQLLRAALPILREHITARTGRRVIGEKTPSNIEAFDTYGALGTKAAIMVQREPFAVLRSMTGRGKDQDDVYAEPFRNDVYRRIGLWLEYNATMQRARRHANMVILKYEALVKAPADIISDLFSRTGVEQSDALLTRASNGFRERTKGMPWDGLRPMEVALIRSLTRIDCDATGYDDAFYDSSGFVDVPIEGADLSDYGVYAVSGIHLQDAGATALWLTSKGHFALQTHPGARSAELSFWTMFPDCTLPGETEASLMIRDGAGREVGRATVTRKAEHTAIWVDLTQTAPVLENATGALRLYSFEASHSFRPLLSVVEAGGLRKLLGRDRRELSFALTAAQFI